ncbi:hypothetical protein MRB53_008164 [Persea americana]|uniref:Uncharacterized protein n=1 Tax=Persea americana TaxID=3435 RepID=A0ACC2MLX7_PERAE|nr:hypothetical protein MRB53_008164 [Persea americana]|eukprot:TRINITY_DN7058_c0_g1_i1.p1 TRINITY_DN7058_c0_g1~~TRINITY_DN7058_c0_g1_i1.p1  ORF type:complete len:146 (-),score=23.89 TRINITY_DN7058_c0_g1_i1:401-838(-)
MDKPSGHHIRKPKQVKSKKKPIKVVYISNPMKVKTSVSQFRALVQGLTGRDSDLADIKKNLAIDGMDELQRVADHEAEATDYVPSPARPVTAVDHERESSASTGSEFELYDDLFTTEMLEHITELSPSRLLLEPQEDIFRGFEIV